MENKTEEFIKKARVVHGDKYDYSKVEYVNITTKVCIICPIHGEFWQTPQVHLRGSNCPKCALKIIKDKNTKSLKEFIRKSREIHGDKYDYSKTEYVNNKTKVCIICPIHGEFWTTPQVHLRGGNCPKCNTDSVKKSTEEFIKQSKKIHDDKYDYSKVEYINASTKVCIICPKHGEFWVRPYNHLHHNGCPLCKSEKIGDLKRKTKEQFIDKANTVHSNKYSYQNSHFKSIDDKISIVCPIHGEFWQRVGDHLRGCGCPKCANQQSLAEEEIYKHISSKIGDQNVLERNHNILKSKKEIDIYIPSKKIGIEFNGLYWHTEEYGKDKFFHLSKTDEALSLGINLIQIFEDEWNENKSLVLSKIDHILGIQEKLPKIMGRKVKIKAISNKEAKDFLNSNHIQGFIASSIYIGAFYNKKLIGVISFTEEKKGLWNLTRMATDINYVCNGVCGKMLSFFVKNYKWNKIKTFADRRWTCNEKNNIYTKLGFKLIKVLEPDYRYLINKKRVHKFNFRKRNLCKKFNLSMELTEKEMARILKLKKIWDCGLFKYELENNN